MVNLYQKAIAIAALITFQGLQAQVGVSKNMNFRPDPNIALHVDGKLKVRGDYKAQGDTPAGLTNNGQIDQIVQINNGNPTWVNSPVSLLEEGMYYIENTYTTTSTTGVTIAGSIGPTMVSENESFNTTIGWVKIAEFKDGNSIKNFNIIESSNNINILIETGLQISGGTINNNRNIKYACGLFSKANNTSDNQAVLRAYRIGQINGITDQTIHNSNFNLLYTIKDFPVGNYNFFIGCKKIGQTHSTMTLTIGGSSNSNLSTFTNRALSKIDILYKL